jgi:3-oxoacyl-[acyl-carrier-protein] synthase II
MNNKRVVITGAAMLTSLGLSMNETWDALLSGKCGIQKIEDFDAEGFKCKHAAQAHGFDPSVLDIHPRESRIMDLHSYMLMKCSRDAFRASLIDSAFIEQEEIGFFASIGMVDYNIRDLLSSVFNSLDSEGKLDYDKFYSTHYQEIYPLWPLSMLNNISLCQVAIDIGIKGENTVFTPHADSCIHAIIEAFNTVVDGKAKAILTGGVSEKISPLSLARASLANILNESDHNCLPFGRERKGTILGEGCGIMVVETQEAAEKRHVNSLAAITGYGSSFDLDRESISPSSVAISASMKDALRKAELNPSDIDLVIAHGDGTAGGDKNEIDAIQRTFSECIDRINVFSSKGSMGHLLAGSPAVDIILGIKTLEHGIIPPVHGSLPLQDDIRFNVIREPLKADPERILINALSYEGQCASLILEAIKKPH